MSAHSAEDGDICPICLEPLPVKDIRNKGRSRASCCGQEMCASCYASRRNHDISLIATVNAAGPLSAEGREASQVLLANNHCPMCRTKLPTTDDEDFWLVKSRVEEHDDWGWAHLRIGHYYVNGTGCKVDYERAFLHFSKAAELGNSGAALHAVANFFRCGRGVRESLAEATRFYEAAAALGCALSQFELAQIFVFEKMDETGAVPMCRAAAEQGVDRAQIMLAVFFEEGKAVGRSLEKALHWYREAAEQGNARGVAGVARNLMAIAVGKYGGMAGACAAVGDCALPEALYWGRRALAAEPEEESKCIPPKHRGKAATFVEYTEMHIAGHCENCGQSGSLPRSSVPLRWCQCKGAFYCSKTYQRDHWRKGHKWDCCGKDGVKLTKFASLHLVDSQIGLPAATVVPGFVQTQHARFSEAFKNLTWAYGVVLTMRGEL